uniref:Uncharacterized protein n=1 Tax=Chromera velia CCMP2878 TaxID=1169474 RepID=A0A0G4GKQ2_9ALVE|eukprot:Cvel_22347.t1-p1 / transcript=Cvel_22347.t1 / gene=Cvel_22347 / organism=Chromera_velia_CCMP2878 / gene_product=hypothetical protein / transcript_product=hypothetical protein / location=Cvel_scaffold2188:2644-6171(+) / protein_length=240 / sequence_SO=supercontig / SO=protein_coding / is_pseudo=false
MPGTPTQVYFSSVTRSSIVLSALSAILLGATCVISVLVYEWVDDFQFSSERPEENNFLRSMKLGALWRISAVITAVEMFRIFVLVLFRYNFTCPCKGCVRVCCGGKRRRLDEYRGDTRQTTRVGEPSKIDKLLAKEGPSDVELSASQWFLSSDFVVQLVIKGLALGLFLFFSSEAVTEMQARVEWYFWIPTARAARNNFIALIEYLGWAQILVFSVLCLLLVDGIQGGIERGKLEGTKTN